MAENGLQSAERFTSGVLDEAERAGPVATALAKRMRWANKRMEKIFRTEEKARAQPDNLNEDQKETLASKAGTLAISEELKRLMPLLEEAKMEEVDAAVQKAVEKAIAEERATVAAQAPPTPKQPEGISQEHRSQVEQETINRLLPLLYFSQTFDFDKPGTMVQLERNACLSFYNHHFPDRDGELTPDDLLLMCKLGSLLTTRNTNECISHTESLERAQDLAAQWLHPTAEPVPLLDSHTMDDVSSCLKRVMASDYITVRPVPAQNTSSAQNGPVHVPEDGQHSSDSRPAHSERPHMQAQESGRGFHPSPDGYPHQEGYPPQDARLHPSQQNGYLQQHGQGYHQDSVPALNFMTTGSATTGDPLSHEQPSLNSRSSQQHPGHTDISDSSFANGPLPSEGISGIVGQSEGSSVPVQAALSGPQASYGTRQRGDGAGRPERQGSGFRGNSRGRGRGRGDGGGRGRGRGRGEGSRGRAPRGGHDHARGDGNDSARGNASGYDHPRNAPNGYGNARGGQGGYEEQSTW